MSNKHSNATPNRTGVDTQTLETANEDLFDGAKLTDINPDTGKSYQTEANEAAKSMGKEQFAETVQEVIAESSDASSDCDDDDDII